MPYSYYIFINSISSLANSNDNEILLMNITDIGVHFTFHLSILAMFWCLFFGIENLLELANEGINLYRSVTVFKKYPRPSTDRYFWLLFVKNVLVGIPMAFIMTVNIHINENWSSADSFKSLLEFYVDIIYTCFLDLKNIVLFVTAYLLKLLRLELLALNKNFNDSKLRANELQRITKQYHKILNYLHKVDELLNIYTSIVFLYIFIDLTSLVITYALKSLQPEEIFCQ
jgi:hypothetical protein